MRAQLIELTPESRDLIAEAVVVEHALHERLAVVEGAVDLERMDVVVVRGRHHPPLHVGDAAVRKQHVEIGAGAAAERFDRRAAGVARGRDHHGGALAALREDVVHQPAQELHRQILEGERRAVKQLQHELARTVLPQRRNRRMAEAAIGLTDHAGEFVFGNFVAYERSDDLDGDFRVRSPRKGGDLLRSKLRPAHRHEQAAVAGEPRNRHVDESERVRLAPGRNILHGSVALRPM